MGEYAVCLGTEYTDEGGKQKQREAATFWKSRISIPAGADLGWHLDYRWRELVVYVIRNQ